MSGGHDRRARAHEGSAACLSRDALQQVPRRDRGGFIAAAKATARLIEEGIRVYSPIAHTHTVAVHGGLNPFDHSLWIPFEEAMMAAADVACVAMLPTWKASFGVQHEIQHFTAAGKPVLYLACEGSA